MISRFIVGLTLFTCVQVHAADKYALLIGVSKYDHAEMRELQFPEEDARALGDLLKSGGYEVEVLLGKEATQKVIHDRLAKLNKKGTGEGVVIVGLFGHGVEITVRNDKGQIVRDASGKEINEGCFCPFDTGMQLVIDEKGKSRSSDNGNPLTEPVADSLVKLSEIMLRLNVAKAGNRVVFADCCRTVPNQARSRSFGASFQMKDLPRSTSVLFGCSEGEEAFEHPSWGHGAFTKCLLDEIPRLSAQGDADTGSLAAQLRKKVPLLVSSVTPNGKQRPKTFVTDIVDLQLASFSSSNPNTLPNSLKTIPEDMKSINPLKSEKPEVTIRGFEGSMAGDRKELAQGITFRWCPAGAFAMGDESPVNVTLTSGFWLGETEVTQRQWRKVMETVPWNGEKGVKEDDNCPATYISHENAVSYCMKLTNQERDARRLPKGWTYKLPTEAQWEYGCRAGTISKWSFRGNSDHLSEYGWFEENVIYDGQSYAHRVGLKKPNAWGLKDMHGNVEEWCSDWFSDKLVGGHDPIGAGSGFRCVCRGGGWNQSAYSCMSSSRDKNSPNYRECNLGFRLAAVASKE